MQFSKDWTYATTCTCFVILFNTATSNLISSNIKTSIEIVLTNLVCVYVHIYICIYIHTLSQTQLTWRCEIFLQSQRNESKFPLQKHFLTVEELDWTQDCCNILLCICNCSWGGKAFKYTYGWAPGAVERSGAQHDVAVGSQPRTTVARHLLARGHFTQMGNSLQRVPTYKTYNPRQNPEDRNNKWFTCPCSPNKVNH